jgi:DNA-binding NarL/FixJ family response regulator
MSGAEPALSYSPWRDPSALRRLVIVAELSAIVHGIETAICASAEFDFVGRVDLRDDAADLILCVEPDVVLLDDTHHSERALDLVGEIRAHDSEVALIVLGLDLGPAWLDRAFRAGATAAISAATQPLALVTLVSATIDGHIVHRGPADAAPRHQRHGSSLARRRGRAGASLSLVAAAARSAP